MTYSEKFAKKYLSPLSIPDAHDIICQAAKTRNEKEIKSVLEVVSINVRNTDGVSPACKLIQEGDIDSAHFLFEKFSASLYEIMFGFASTVNIPQVNQIIEAHPDLINFLYLETVRGYSYAKRFDLVQAIFDLYPEDETSMLYYQQGLGAGLGNWDFTPFTTIDNKEIIFYEGLILGYARRGFEDKIDILFNQIDAKYKNLFLKRIAQGYAQGNHIDALKKLIASNPLKSLELLPYSVFGSASSGLIDELNKLLASGLVPLTTFISQTIRGLAVSGYTGSCIEYFKYHFSTNCDFERLIYFLAAGGHKDVVLQFLLKFPGVSRIPALLGFARSGEIKLADDIFINTEFDINYLITKRFYIDLVFEYASMGMVREIQLIMDQYTDQPDHMLNLRLSAAYGYAKMFFLSEVEMTVASFEDDNKEVLEKVSMGLAESGYDTEAIAFANTHQDISYHFLGLGFAKARDYEPLSRLYEQLDQASTKNFIKIITKEIRKYFFQETDARLNFATMSSARFSFALATALDHDNDSIVEPDKYINIAKEVRLVKNIMTRKNTNYNEASLWANDSQGTWLFQGYQLVIKNIIPSEVYLMIAAYLSNLNEHEFEVLQHNQNSFFRPHIMKDTTELKPDSEPLWRRLRVMGASHF
jgi:hypothetical protein